MQAYAAWLVELCEAQTREQALSAARRLLPDSRPGDLKWVTSLLHLLRRWSVVSVGGPYETFWRSSAKAACHHAVGVCHWCRPFGLHGQCEHLYTALTREGKLKMQRPWEPGSAQQPHM